MTIDEKIADQSVEMLKPLTERGMSLVELIVEVDELYITTSGLFTITYKQNPTTKEAGLIYILSTKEVIKKYEDKDIE